MTVEDPLAAHLFSQIEQNVHVLASQGYLSQADADAILNRLPGANGHSAAVAKPPGAMSQLSSKFSNMISPSQEKRAVPPPPPQSHAAPPVQYAKAIWGYNENGQVRGCLTITSWQSYQSFVIKDPKDLTFSSGDIIEIVDETNADWWTGRFNGREGLVPANYVEKIEAAPSMPEPGTAAASARRPYKPFGAVYHGVQTAPPPAPPQGVNPVGLQEHPDNEKKKSKYGGLKNTVRRMQQTIRPSFCLRSDRWPTRRLEVSDSVQVSLSRLPGCIFCG